MGIVIAFWFVVFAVLVGVYAHGNGRSGIGFFFLSLLLSPLLGFLIVLALGKPKLCPECAERVKAAARVCRFCGFKFAE